MQSPEFFEKLEQSMKERGVTSRASQQLVAEFQDHYQCGLQERMGQGMSPREAEFEAVASLGDPGYLAEAAANKWRARLWSNRHPWLFGMSAGLGAYLLATLFILLAAYVAFHVKRQGWLSPDSPLVSVIVFLCMLTNWLPALAGGLYMGWGYRTKRFQSRTFWIGCAGVALGASLFCVDVLVPTAAHHGSLTVNTGPLASGIYWVIASLMHKEEALGYTSWRVFLGSATTWLQVVLTFGFALAINAARLTASRQRERDA